MIDHLPEDVQLRIREKLLGKDNVARLENQKTGRKFRPTAVIVTYGFYRMHNGAYHNWRINRIENGRQEVHLQRLDEIECGSEVIALRSKGFTVRELTIGLPRAYANRMSPKGRIDVGNHKKIMDELKDFNFLSRQAQKAKPTTPGCDGTKISNKISSSRKTRQSV